MIKENVIRRMATRTRVVCCLWITNFIFLSPAFSQNYNSAISIYTDTKIGDDGLEFKPPTRLVCGGYDYRCYLSVHIGNGGGERLTVTVFDIEGKELKPFAGSPAKYYPESDEQAIRQEFRYDPAVEIGRFEIKGPSSGRVSFFYFGNHAPPHLDHE